MQRKEALARISEFHRTANVLAGQIEWDNFPPGLRAQIDTDTIAGNVEALQRIADDNANAAMQRGSLLVAYYIATCKELATVTRKLWSLRMQG